MGKRRLPEKLTTEELARVPELKARVGPVIDLADKRLTDDEAVILEMAIFGTDRSEAWEILGVIRGKVPGDVVDGYMEVDDAE